MRLPLLIQARNHRLRLLHHSQTPPERIVEPNPATLQPTLQDHVTTHGTRPKQDRKNARDVGARSTVRKGSRSRKDRGRLQGYPHTTGNVLNQLLWFLAVL